MVKARKENTDRRHQRGDVDSRTLEFWNQALKLKPKMRWLTVTDRALKTFDMALRHKRNEGKEEAPDIRTHIALVGENQTCHAAFDCFRALSSVVRSLGGRPVMETYPVPMGPSWLTAINMTVKGLDRRKLDALRETHAGIRNGLRGNRKAR